MDLKEAQTVIRDDKAAPVDWIMAGAEISASAESSYEDLLECLKRKGSVASGAATTLYVRTKRPHGDDILTLSMNYDDWLSFLRGRGFVRP